MTDKTNLSKKISLQIKVRSGNILGMSDGIIPHLTTTVIVLSFKTHRWRNGSLHKPLLKGFTPNVIGTTATVILLTVGTDPKK